MKRWKKVVIWISSIIVVLGITGLLVANYMIDRFLSSLATEDVVVAEVAGVNNQIVEEKPEVTVNPDTAEKDTTGAVKQDDAEVSAEGETSSKVEDKKEEQDTSSKDAVDKQSGSKKEETNENKPKLDTSYSAEVSSSKAEAIKENVTVKEKAQVTSILLGELDMDDIKKLQGLASGGLSVEEKKEARRILLEKISPDQYNALSSIAKKYGASEGKSYDQVSKEEGLTE
ncbi:hypothetical protein [Paenibacillus xanthanilyticus]|uniref:Uncharacterized protein n=1 Tax=Paenibacillus xanthanilyticus TaxID=1783531 RepID=A0ABV8K339_9BACL